MLAVRLGEALNLDDITLREVYYQALLRYIGCNAETYMLASIFGDELAMRTDYATVDAGKPSEMLKFVIRRIRASHEGEPPLEFARLIATGILAKPQIDREYWPNRR